MKKRIFEMQCMQESLQIELILYLHLSCHAGGKTYKFNEGGEAFSQNDLTGLMLEINLMNIKECGGSFPMAHPILNIREFIPNRERPYGCNELIQPQRISSR